MDDYKSETITKSKEKSNKYDEISNSNNERNENSTTLSFENKD